MLKLRKVIKNQDSPSEIIETSEFDLNKMSWSFQKGKSFFIENTPFAKGGFREVFKADTESGETYVVKKFLETTLFGMEEVNKEVKVK